MTGKRRPRGAASRLEVLEATAGVRREGVEAAKDEQAHRALLLLSAADRAAWRDAGRVLECGADPDGLARMRRACAHLPHDLPVSHPAKIDAEAWAEMPDALGVSVLAPHAHQAADFSAYFEACAAWCDAEAARLPLSPDVHRLARWGAAMWRYDAALCQVIGGQG